MMRFRGTQTAHPQEARQTIIARDARPRDVANLPAARQRPWRDAEIVGGEVSFEPPSPFTSFDHLVGECEYIGRNFEAERLGGFEVDDQLELGGLLHREIGRRCAS